MPVEMLLTALVALAFAATHIAGPAMRFLRATPRSAWLSFAGGVSVAYVFVHVLPELAAHQDVFRRRLDQGGGLEPLESHVYLIALLGLAVFYGLDRLARGSARQQERSTGTRRASAGVFWIHLGSFAAYNILIGYLLQHREEADLRGLGIYALAMGLHFIVNDQGLREQHGQAYDRQGRWILALAPIFGWLLGLAAELPSLAISALFAFLMGGVVLNVLKEELPEDRESRFSAFAIGAAAYAALLLVSA